MHIQCPDFRLVSVFRLKQRLELLVKQKRMAKTQPVPCVIRDGGIAEDDSLAENDERVGLLGSVLELSC